VSDADRTADSETGPPTAWSLGFERPGGDTLRLRLAGSWRAEAGLPGPAEVRQRVEADPAVRRMAFDSAGVTGWDSGLLVFLGKLVAANARAGIETDQSGLPEGVRRLLALAGAAPDRKGAKPEGGGPPFLARVGLGAAGAAGQAASMLAFLGEVSLGLLRLCRGAGRLRRGDFVLLIQECGVQALPIVTLISFLVGVILAYVGAIQLRQFGAQIYVADLVGIAMTREMGAMMAGIIMAGRTGAAFAAELGTMQVSEEIDALATLGISPMDFLVLPRLLALTAMMPLLCLYADMMGILGGAAVGLGMLDLGGVQYSLRTAAAIEWKDILVGLIKSGAFGVLVAVAGCLRGMECGRNSAAVGWAATSAVVTGIVSIIVSDAAMTVIFDLLGF
jgi:phospholipid/cholesterol/gamma-HCH transport system permease protein